MYILFKNVVLLVPLCMSTWGLLQKSKVKFTSHVLYSIYRRESTPAHTCTHHFELVSNTLPHALAAYFVLNRHCKRSRVTDFSPTGFSIYLQLKNPRKIQENCLYLCSSSSHSVMIHYYVYDRMHAEFTEYYF